MTWACTGAVVGTQRAWERQSALISSAHHGARTGSGAVVGTQSPSWRAHRLGRRRGHSEPIIGERTCSGAASHASRSSRFHTRVAAGGGRGGATGAAAAAGAAAGAVGAAAGTSSGEGGEGGEGVGAVLGGWRLI